LTPALDGQLGFPERRAQTDRTKNEGRRLRNVEAKPRFAGVVDSVGFGVTPDAAAVSKASRGIGRLACHCKRGRAMSDSNSEKNKEIVLQAFDTLFNKRDYASAERFWSPHYIQHSAHIETGRDGLFNLIKAAPPSLKYESGVILAEGDYVILHGRFSNIRLPSNWIAADIVRLKDGILVEHWDVIQDEATEQQSKSGNPMFRNSFPK
jgi:predicted SnoaL-like aldol condensation-catalyzing enzyme